MSYFIGKIGQVGVTGVLQAALLLGFAVFVLGVDLPTDPASWATFAWVFVLGITTSALLGVALSALPRTGKSATAVVVPIALALQFISGVYLSFSQLPDWLQDIASIFPLKWMAQGMRAVFLPDGLRDARAQRRVEPGGCRDRADHLARRRAGALADDLPLDPARRVA